MVYISICINVMVIPMHTVIVYVRTYTCTYVYSYTYCVRTCFSHSMNVVYFPSQESFNFTSHHLIGSQCHPSNHKVHVRTHIPIVN